MFPSRSVPTTHGIFSWPRGLGQMPLLLGLHVSHAFFFLRKRTCRQDRSGAAANEGCQYRHHVSGSSPTAHDAEVSHEG
jgi:hypothetical protein